MKICLINNLFRPFSRGGAEAAVGVYADSLKSGRHSVFIITTLPRGQACPQKADDIYYLKGLSSYYYHLKHLPIVIRFLWHVGNLFNIGSYLNLIRIFKSEKPDLIMTHNLVGVGLLSAIAIKRLRIRHFHYLHDIQLLHPSGLILYGKENMIDKFAARIYQKITNFLIGSPEKVISPSNWLLQQHLKRGYFSKSEKLILDNPFNLPIEYSGASVDRYFKNISTDIPHKFKFLFVGQLEEHKGISLLIEAFSKMNPDICELNIVGGGSEENRLKKITENSRNVFFQGRVPREIVPKLMAAADCLVVPSLCYENAPSVIFEAFASGLTVIGSAIGGITELIGDDWTFRPGNVDELTAKMIWVLEQQQQAGRQKSESPDRILQASPAIILDRLGL